MKRSIFVAAILCVACGAHRQARGLDDVTTTSAVIRAQAPTATLEAPAILDVYEGPTAIATPITSSTMDDVRIALDVGHATSATESRAELALRYVADGRVRDFAQLVHDRAHEAKLQMSLVSVMPDAAEPPASLQKLAGQSQVDFDRGYVALETRALGQLIQRIDALAPQATASELRRRLLDLRPQLVDLWTRADDLQQTLVNAP